MNHNSSTVVTVAATLSAAVVTTETVVATAEAAVSFAVEKERLRKSIED